MILQHQNTSRTAGNFTFNSSNISNALYHISNARLFFPSFHLPHLIGISSKWKTTCLRMLTFQDTSNIMARAAQNLMNPYHCHKTLVRHGDQKIHLLLKRKKKSIEKYGKISFVCRCPTPVRC